MCQMLLILVVFSYISTIEATRLCLVALFERSVSNLILVIVSCLGVFQVDTILQRFSWLAIFRDGTRRDSFDVFGGKRCTDGMED